MSDKALLRRFDTWRSEGRTLVLATVVGTAGSTYTKAGHRILIADSGDYQGLVSGGCLEGDLAAHAREVIASGEARLITYDLRGENEELFGLGIGCDGLLRILLQRLSPDGDYAPFARMADVQRGDTPCHCAVILSDRGEFRVGDTLFDAVAGDDGSAPAPADVLHTTLRPLPRLLVLGGGPDAAPVVTLADLLGWRVTVADHRPAYLDRPAFAVADARISAPAATLANQVTLAHFAAAIVMSHHLATDRSYLTVLAASPIPYIGLLGPPGRRDRLLRELGDDAGALGSRLHGPAGLDIGADSPESIALSILAEVQALDEEPLMTEARRRITVAEAAALIHARLKGWGTVRAPIDAAQGEVLRQAITAERDQPPFDRVTMDGIAIRHGAFAAGRWTFRVAGTQGAGSAPLPVQDDGDCVAIMTGAALPPGADTVIPVERITREGATATLESGYRPAAGQFVHRRASDHPQGATLLSAGALVGAPEMAVLTAGGSDTVEIARRPAITVVSTGDELVDVGLPLAPTQIRSSNDRAIAAALATRGFIDCDRLHLPDDRRVLETALGELLAEQDVLILTGGVSMGEFDYVPQVLQALGMELVFHKVLQRPGMPLWFGVSPAGKPVFALPGNPVSSLVCLVRYVAPALVAALGAAPRPDMVVRLAQHVRFEPDLAYFLPVTLTYGADGECLATPKPTNTSGDFVALGGTDGFVELPRGMSDFAPGYTARFYPW